MKEKKAKSSFSAREVATLLEDLRAKFGTVAEQFKSLEGKADATMGMVAENKQILTMQGIRLTALETKLSATKTNLSAIEDEIKQINGKLAKIEDDVRIIKTDFSKRLTVLEASPK